MLTVQRPFKVFLQVGLLTCAFISPVVALDFTIDGVRNAGSIAAFNTRAVRSELLPRGEYKISITSGAIVLGTNALGEFAVTAISFRVGETGPIFDLGVLDIPPELQQQERYADEVQRSRQEAFEAYLSSSTPFQIVTLQAPAVLLFYLIDNLEGDGNSDNEGSLVVRVEPLAASLTVPGTSNPWLAGMPNGSTAIGNPPSYPIDTAPEESPILFTPVVPGSFLSFEVTGSVNHFPSPSGLTPDGGSSEHPRGVDDLTRHISENGIASFNGPGNSLLGVFLDDSQPNLSPAPGEFPYLPNALTIAPGLKQVFFIGDGLTGTGSGAIQQFLAPAGATRLFLGTFDVYEWSNNFGEFVTTITTITEDADGDGVPDDADECSHSDRSATVIIGGCDSEVTNTVFPSGCTLTDLLADCADHAGRPHEFVPCVASLTNTMVQIGIITGQQKGAMQSCAAQADLP